MERREPTTKIYEKLHEIVKVLLDPVIAAIFALFIGAVIITVLGDSVVVAYSALWKGAFGSTRSMGQTFMSATPLIFTGLAFSVAFRCGLFNIGSEGQLYMGAIIGAWAGYAFTGLPSLAHVSLVLILGGTAGAAWGFLPGFLKAKLGVHEVINTIMMTYIAINLTNWLVSSDGPMRHGSTLQATPFVADTARLKVLIPSTRLTTGIIIAFFVAFCIWVLLWKTKLGYKVRAVGLNNMAAECGGIDSNRYIIYAMMISGALAGLGGAVETIGVHGRFYSGFSPGYGFEGIAVAMLGANHPAGILLSALLFGALKSGAMTMQIVAGTNSELVKILQAIIIFFIAGKWSIITHLESRQKKKDGLKSNIRGDETWKQSTQ
ncbi:MAG: ABC transporter permease [Dethiobacter sp.]|nr:ABC transporter permease [Dethiobacter sp.]